MVAVVPAGMPLPDTVIPLRMPAVDPVMVTLSEPLTSVPALVGPNAIPKLPDAGNKSGLSIDAMTVAVVMLISSQV
jgi:hypothetical protein